MRIHRRWSSCAIVLAALSVVSCAEGQFGQVMQNVGKSMAKGMCAEGNGPASAAPEFCLYVTELRLLGQDTQADVSLLLVNRTGRRIFVSVPDNLSFYLTDSSGAKWSAGHGDYRGIPMRGYGPTLPLEPGVDAPISVQFRRQGQAPGDPSFSLRGEIAISKVDSRGEPVGYEMQVARGLSISGIRLVQESQQSAQPLQQKASSVPPPTVVQGTSPGTNGATIPAGTRAVVPLALATASNSVTAIAGSRTWDGLDISGFRIGMMAEEVSQKLKKNDLPLVIQEYHAELSDMPNTKFFSHVIGVSKNRDVTVGELELIAASFAPTPNKSIVGQISRIRRYPNGHQATFQNTKEALMEKYGVPSFKWIGQSGVIVEEWTWVFDRDGAQIAPPSLDRQCHLAIQADLQFRNSNSLFNPLSQAMDQCGRVLSVRMQIDKANRVWQLESFMMDNYFVQDALARTTSMVSDFKSKQLEKQIQGAEKQGKPKL